MLWSSVTQALAPVAHLEEEWDISKLEKRVREYLRKAGKTLEYRTKPWQQLVNDYADAAFASIFQALNDRKWLSKVDFVWTVDAGIKEMFPKKVLNGVKPLDFERCVLGAHDRAFEDQWYLPVLWEHVQGLVLEGKAARKKVYDAMDHGRKAAARGSAEGAMDLKEFVARWVEASVARLSKACQGYPESALEEPLACQLFHSLVEAETLPIALIAASGGQPPHNWPFVDYAVHQAYVALSNGGENAVAIDGAAIARGKNRGGAPGNQGLPIWARAKAKAKPMAKVQCSAAETAALARQPEVLESLAGGADAAAGADDEDSWGKWLGAGARASVAKADDEGLHGENNEDELAQSELEAALRVMGDGEVAEKDEDKMVEDQAREKRDQGETAPKSEDWQIEQKDETWILGEHVDKHETERRVDHEAEDKGAPWQKGQQAETEDVWNIGDQGIEEAAYPLGEQILCPPAKRSRSEGTV